jgi:hypothetical protein
MKKLQLVCLAVLLSFLASCGLLAQQPPNQAVRLAVTQQLTHAQQTIAQELGLANQSALKPNFKLEKLDIQSRTKVSEPRFQQKGYPHDIYKVQGSFNATLTTAERKIRQSSPFEVYLGTNPEAGAPSEGKSDSNSDSKVETWFLIDTNEVKPTQPLTP